MYTATATAIDTAAVTTHLSPATAEFYTWLLEQVQNCPGNVNVLRNADGNVSIEIQKGTHGRGDVNFSVPPCPFTDEVFDLALAELRKLQAAGTHTVYWTDRGVRAGLRADWLKKYHGRPNGTPPAGFVPGKPYYLQPIADEPKKRGGVGAWGGFRHPLTPRPTTNPVNKPRFNLGPRPFAPPAPASSSSTPDPWSDDELDAIGA